MRFSARLEPVHRLGPCLTALVCATLLAGCGGDGGETAPGPTLPSALASDLAAQSDAIAEAYASGDVCGAAGQADDLLDQVLLAIEEGRVPGAFQESLTSIANKLVNEINCPEALPPPPEEEGPTCEELEEQKKALEDKRKDEEKGKGKAKGRERQRDEQIADLEQQIEDCREGDDGDEEKD